MFCRESIFTLGIDTEEVLETGFTDLKSRNGDLLIVRFRAARPVAGGNVYGDRMANLMHIS